MFSLPAFLTGSLSLSPGPLLPSIHSKEIRKQEAEQKSKLKSPIQMPVCAISSMSVTERQRRGERVEGMRLAVGRCPHWAGSHTVFNGKPTLGDHEEREQ